VERDHFQGQGLQHEGFCFLSALCVGSIHVAGWALPGSVLSELEESVVNPRPEPFGRTEVDLLQELWDFGQVSVLRDSDVRDLYDVNGKTIFVGNGQKAAFHFAKKNAFPGLSLAIWFNHFRLPPIDIWFNALFSDNDVVSDPFLSDIFDPLMSMTGMHIINGHPALQEYASSRYGQRGSCFQAVLVHTHNGSAVPIRWFAQPSVAHSMQRFLTSHEAFVAWRENRVDLDAIKKQKPVTHRFATAAMQPNKEMEMERRMPNIYILQVRPT
jgi:hypothetical protein